MPQRYKNTYICGLTDYRKMLSPEEKERYARHLVLQEIGEEGQERIKNAKVLVVGAGGLGSPILLYLAAAGVGQIGIVDDDYVSESNLQRQILYDTTCIAESKVEIAAHKLHDINPFCKVLSYPFRLTEENAMDLIKKYDIIVDATDNLSTRYVINDASVATGCPFVYGSICEFTGQVSVFNYQGGPTYRDLFEFHDDVASFQQPLGVVGALPGVVGAIQASETIKLILGQDDILSGKLLMIDLLHNTFNTIKF